MTIHFILGGARSGKSRLAEKEAIESTLKVTYLATATIGDDEMESRIRQHKNNRPTDWDTIEEPLDLVSVIRHLNHKDHCILIDCLTLWMSNLLALENEQTKNDYINQFISEITASSATIILVSNEVGNGIVPMGALTRAFVDESGFLHQRIAQVADSVKFIMAGLSINLKG